MRTPWILVVAGALIGPPASAQPADPVARLGMDTEMSVRTSVARDGTPQTVLMIDGVQHVRVTGDWTIVSRPMAVQRTGADWALHLAQLAVRRDFTGGPVSMRVEAGLLPSPVGLASLTARASANPTITPAAPFGRGVTVANGAPAVQLYPLTYPFGAVASFSARTWDARVGLVDTTPLRVRWPLEEYQGPAAAHLLVGGGITLRPGLRAGGWFMRGDWAKAAEVTIGTRGDRSASSGGVEVEYAVAWTRVAGEWTASRLDTGNGVAVPSTWLIEGTQTLAPRWFAAGRLRHAGAFSTPGKYYTGPLTAAGLRSVNEQSREIVVGYRVSPAVTLRAGYLATRAYAGPAWIHRAQSSIVWAQRWR